MLHLKRIIIIRLQKSDYTLKTLNTELHVIRKNQYES